MARSTLSFGSFNLFNLNEPAKPMYTNKKGWSKAEYDKKIEWSSRVLKDMPADVWGFQELWHKDSLDRMFKQARLGSRYKLLVPKGHNGGRIVCGGAVRKDILLGEPEWIEKFPDNFVMQSGGDDAQSSDIAVQLDSFSRPVLHFQIKPSANKKAVHVFVCHFKSRRPSKIYYESWYKSNKDYYKKHSNSIGYALATVRRTVEAAALRMILTDLTKKTDTPVVVLGDLNDSQLSNTLNILTGQPKYIVSGRKGGSDAALYSAATLQEYRSLRDVYYTHIHNNIKESLDHILVSEEFYDNSKKRVWTFEGMDFRNDHLNEDHHKEYGTSDHGVVRATFK